MKKFLIISLAASVVGGCNNAAQPPNQATTTNAYTNMNANSPGRPNDSAIVSSRSTAAPPTAAPPTANRPASSGSTESPMARPIDVSQMTADIEKAEKDFEKYAKDAKTKQDLAEKYFVRATALTDAAQYRAALGDYRRSLKLDAGNEAARKMHDQILSIFKQIGREPPKEGEEPKPLPMN